jgi:glycosyltransferase involved in cell wall biosynthesis
MSWNCAVAKCDKRRQLHKWFRVIRSAVQKHIAGFPGTIGHFITLSQRSEDILRPYLPKTARFHPLGNVVDVAPRPPVRAGENRALTYVGRLDEEKGVRLLADVVIEAGLPLVMVGDGPLRAELDAMPGITATGWLPPAEVVARLDQARCLVFPSLWYETFGLTVDEAAARGVPAVVSDITAPAERVQDGETGWHFRSGDKAALQAALDRTRDNAAVQKAGEAAYARFWQNAPTRSHHTAKLLRIYELMLSPRFFSKA